MSKDISPLTSYLNTNLSNTINYRKFNSLDIENSPDGINYKNVTSNPTDQVDKMTLMNFGSSSVGENNFDVKD
jgi:hypothetical protein